MSKKLIYTKDPLNWLGLNIREFKRTTVIIFPTEKMLNRLLEKLPEEISIDPFPSHDVFPFEEINTSFGVRSARLKLLRKLIKKQVSIIATTMHSFLRKTIPPDILKGKLLYLAPGSEFKLSASLLQAFGYERVFTVTEPAQFSIKGGIIDIFVPGDDFPVRIEVFDSVIESIRNFDPISQRSISRLENFEFIPGTEAMGLDEYLELAQTRITYAETQTAAKASFKLDGNCNLDTVSGLFYKSQSILADYLPEEVSYIFIEPDKGVDEFSRLEREVLEILDDRPVEKFLYRRFSGIKPEYFFKLSDYIILDSHEPIFLDWDSSVEEESGRVLPERKKKKREFIPVTPLIDWTELEIGDFVVHKDYGIGRYLGVKTISSSLGTREYLTLEYREGTKLYVPIERVDRVHKYIGQEEGVQLNSLKGQRWSKQKRSVEKEVRKRIKELAALYAARENTLGITLKGDSELEEKLKDSFPHVETEDQLRAIEEVLNDLAQIKPMDRLVSGDAGFGKTEVAIRAAFRAVVSGKQVAVLVPTTVLARQHFESFSSRLSPLGVSVKLLDRYTTGKERENLLMLLKKGLIDVVIGTHSLLSDSVRFYDLGLVIIDEEQLFGVMQKEHFKKLRLKVNVLSMSATPIPRTLYMALSGLRELSVIATPPAGRIGAETYVGPRNDKLIRTAVLREINRGGQVIYVHNRVRELADLHEILKRLLPEVSIGMAHGQMGKKQFEKVIGDFYDGNLDMLLCTTIIESGVDIPRANTLIVDDSQRYGLAQLYQLRGRVGRSDRRAFAYFLYDVKNLSPQSRERLKALKEFSGPGSGLRLAMRDMEIRGIGALLGSEQSGNISSVGLYLYHEMLEKAAKEILGKSFEKQEVKDTIDTEIKGIYYDMIIPESYVEDSIERLKIYRRIATARRVSELKELYSELIDRFGAAPKEVQSLFKVARIRLIAHRMGIRLVQYDNDSEYLRLEFADTRGFENLNSSNFKIIFNERESSAFVYGVRSRLVMETLNKLLSGDGKDDF
ncbi:transcription-repair coupling factor [Kosmotoga arenicorallina S304]|uniref:Transcription-repair-coupling factor n=1 Tax=Kosmotoga arenicorallina S304 TaxID=1453497 RepID=A0A182C7Z9_9BACT|nr:transcription-repair coupling factor [Kosmotoga arenicorallina]OAA31878.1 transcription-repair coupling factor [Kosmotoga arenicorallina S304]